LTISGPRASTLTVSSKVSQKLSGERLQLWTTASLGEALPIKATEAEEEAVVATSKSTEAGEAPIEGTVILGKAAASEVAEVGIEASKRMAQGEERWEGSTKMIKESLTRRSGRRCRNLRLLTGKSDSGRDKSKLKLTLIIKGLTPLLVKA